jgi:hypothetical protein
MNSGGELEEDIRKVEECLIAAWDALPSTLFDSLIESMLRRISDCINANG